MSFYLFVVWGVVLSNDAFVLFYDGVAVFLEGVVVVNVEDTPWVGVLGLLFQGIVYLERVGIGVVFLRSPKVWDGSFCGYFRKYGFEFCSFLGGVSPFYGVFPYFVFFLGDALGFYSFFELG